MKKKQYISPSFSLYEVEPCAVYCGSGDGETTYTLFPPTSDGPDEDEDGFCSDAATYRTTLWNN